MGTVGRPPGAGSTVSPRGNRLCAFRNAVTVSDHIATCVYRWWPISPSGGAITHHWSCRRPSYTGIELLRHRRRKPVVVLGINPEHWQIAVLMRVLAKVTKCIDTPSRFAIMLMPVTARLRPPAKLIAAVQPLRRIAESALRQSLRSTRRRSASCSVHSGGSGQTPSPRADRPHLPRRLFKAPTPESAAAVGRVLPCRLSARILCAQPLGPRIRAARTTVPEKTAPKELMRRGHRVSFDVPCVSTTSGMPSRQFIYTSSTSSPLGKAWGACTHISFATKCTASVRRLRVAEAVRPRRARFPVPSKTRMKVAPRTTGSSKVHDARMRNSTADRGCHVRIGFQHRGFTKDFDFAIKDGPPDHECSAGVFLPRPHGAFFALLHLAQSIRRSFARVEIRPRQRTAQCRCGPVTRPVAPLSPMRWPRLTRSPSCTSMRLKCIEIVNSPSP